MKTVIDITKHFNAKRDIDCNEVLQLLKMYGFKFLSWGPQAFTRIGKKAFRFTVNGHHHKGHVYISVNGMDLYDVTLTSRMGTIIEEITDIYFDGLFDILDKKIEYIPEYQNR